MQNFLKTVRGSRMTVLGGGGERRGYQSTIHTRRPRGYSGLLKVQVTEFSDFNPCNRNGNHVKGYASVLFLLLIFRT
jgi:hypothetical protein